METKMSENANNKNYKTPLYTTLAVVIAIFGLALICSVVLLVLWYSIGYSVWMFGRSSSDLLPAFTAVSFLLTFIPSLVIVMCEKQKLKKILIPVCILSVVVSAAIVIITAAFVEPEKNYYLMASDEARYDIIACEMTKGDNNNVIFYQKIDAITMRRISVTPCISREYRPISSGLAQIKWNNSGFRLVFPNDNGEYVIEQVYLFIQD